MKEESLETLTQHLTTLDEERTIIARRAFRLLSSIDHELWALAIDVLDSEEIAARWFAESVPSLGDQMPFCLLTEGKREDLVNCLYQMEHGLFS